MSPVGDAVTIDVNHRRRIREVGAGNGRSRFRRVGGHHRCLLAWRVANVWVGPWSGHLPAEV